MGGNRLKAFRRIFRVQCSGCGRMPEEILEYWHRAEAIHDAVTPSEYIRISEPSFNRLLRRFVCIDCCREKPPEE